MACNPQYWALVVGISHYPGLSELTELVGPEHDAKDFFKWVTSPDGGRVCFDPNGDPATQQARLIVSSDFDPPAGTAFDARPTRGEIEKWLTNLNEVAQQRGDLKVGSRLYLYFAGHGFEAMLNQIDKRGEPVVLMANAQQRALEHVPPRSWAELYFSANYFDEFLLFLDCCREVKTDWPLSVPQLNPGTLDTGAKRFYAFATQPTKLSRERSIDGTTRGLFTYALMQALRGQVADASGRITAQAVKGWLFKKLPTLIDSTDGEVSKVPDIPYPQGSHDDLVITDGAAPSTVPIVVSVPGAAAQTLVEILDTTGQPMDAKPLSADATATFDLEIGSGFYFKAKCGARQLLFEVPRNAPVVL